MRSNSQWINDLTHPGLPQDSALEELRTILLRGLPHALSRWLPSTDPHSQPLIEEVAQATLVRVLDKLDTFEGRSQFTTWANKIAVRIALSELRRKRWQNISLDGLFEDEDKPAPLVLLMDPAHGPATQTEGTDLVSRVHTIIAEELTDRQRRALAAMVTTGIPMEELARRMGTNRNALYKLIHDARLRLKIRLANEGISIEDVLSAFNDR